jgi:hypothetical protein
MAYETIQTTLVIGVVAFSVLAGAAWLRAATAKVRAPEEHGKPVEFRLSLADDGSYPVRSFPLRLLKVLAGHVVSPQNVLLHPIDQPGRDQCKACCGLGLPNSDVPMLNFHHTIKEPE